MTGEEEPYVVLLHVVLNPLGGVHHGRKVGEHQQVGRAESIATEPIVIRLVEERGASCRMTGGEDDLNLTATQINHLAIGKIPDTPHVVTHVVRYDGHVARIQINLRERTYATHVVAVGMGEHHRDGFGGNLGHNLVQPRNACPSVNQKSAAVTLHQVERLVVDSVSIAYPRMLVELAEHHFIILIHHFAAQVATIHIRSLSLHRKGHQAKQHSCQKYVSFHIDKLVIVFIWQR